MLLYRPGWPQTQSNPLALVFQVLRLQVCSAQWFWLRLSKQQLHGLFSPDHFFLLWGCPVYDNPGGLNGLYWESLIKTKTRQRETGQVRIRGASLSFDIVLLPRQSLHAFLCLSHICVMALHSCFTPLTGKGAVWRQWLYYTGAQGILVGWMTNEWRNGLYNTWLRELWRGGGVSFPRFPCSPCPHRAVCASTAWRKE